MAPLHRRSLAVAAALLVATVALAAGCSSSSTGAGGGDTGDTGVPATGPATGASETSTTVGSTPRTRRPPVDGTTVVPGPRVGVLTGTAVGAMACPEGRACPDLAVVITGFVRAEGTAGTGEATIDSTGAWGMQLPPGDYTVTVESTNGTCDPAPAAVTARTITDVPLRCTGS